MRRSAMVGAWVLATALAVGVGIGAVQLAGAQVTDSPIQPLSADEVPTQAAPPDSAPAGSDPPRSPPSTTAAPTTTPPLASASTTTEASDPAPTATTVTTTPASTTTPTSTTTTTTIASTTTTPPTISSQPKITVHTLIGGSISIASSPGVVNLVWATPNAGFTVEVEADGPTEVDVDFKSASHESKFDATWTAGTLDVRVREEGDD